MRHNPCDGKVKGRIICTSSLAGIEPEPAVPQYSGAKAGVIHFARATAPVLWEKDAITMNVVCPGLVTTPLAPKELLDASLPEHRTSMELVLRAFDDFIDRDDGKRNGEVVAAHAAKITEVGKSYLTDTVDGADESVRRVSKVLMRLVQGDE
ncbi:short chain dehydrogenase [Colletotrichum truncatum]|uniref:Short chain dehydrogenase n=1 Tax=Colletotrichum truncatum TaxID=5467 RepID=A0ACC3Z3N8_COLTU|nr:short chain dehydrogenase [Colletotrichum truncatum]KAF6793101.1 short chain dehydrogenase [Colletotrichum truncatum]